MQPHCFIGQHYGGALAFQLEGANVFLYFSRSRGHWVIGPGPLLPTASNGVTKLQVPPTESETSRGVWAEYDLHAPPTDSKVFPRHFDASKWHCYSGIVLYVTMYVPPHHGSVCCCSTCQEPLSELQQKALVQSTCLGSAQTYARL